MSKLDDLSTTFNQYCQLVKLLPQRPKDDDLLYLYGKYKQVTCGDINETKPSGLFNIKAQKKWESWNNNKSKSKELCMKEYINRVKQLMEV